MAQAVEQRECQRITLLLKVSCISVYKVFDAHTENLSLSGALLKSPVEFSPGKDLTIVFNPPGLRSMFTVQAQVIWSSCLDTGGGASCYQLGVRYRHLTTGHRRIFSEVLNAAGSS